jgi:hypothetical protein
MPSMTAGQLDIRNIGSNVSFEVEDGTIAGSLAVVVQTDDQTEIVLAHDDESLIVSKDAQIEVALPPVAAYLLGLKQFVESNVAKS